MSKWKTVRLGDVLIQQDKSKIKAGEGIDDGVYPFYTCSNELTKQINTAQYKGPALIFGTGGKASVHFCSGSFSTSTDCLVYKTSKEVNLSLVNKYLRKNMYLLENGFKGAGLKHISREYIANIEISLPEILEQNKLVSQFDLIESSITNHKKMLEKYDTLIKSRFIEMFGDPVTNPNGWEIVPFSEVIEYMGDIGSNGANQTIVAHLDMTSTENYALIVRFLNFTNNDFTNDVKYISEANYNFFKKSKIYGGELIFCKIGSAGLNYIMPFLNRPVSLGLNQIMTRVNDKIKMAYLYQYLNSDYGKYLISQRVQGAVTKSITKTALKEMPIVLPPLSLQNQFAAFVQQIDKSKFAVQKSLEKAETLYKSLMQKFFGY